MGHKLLRNWERKCLLLILFVLPLILLGDTGITYTWKNERAGFVRGAEFGVGRVYPYLLVVGSYDAEAKFYAGEPGDTSNFLTIGEPDILMSYRDRKAFKLRDYIQAETISVWAQITDGDTVISTDSIVLNEINSENAQLVNWPMSIKSTSAGDTIIFKPKFASEFLEKLEIEGYWGDTGDTSTLAFTVPANYMQKFEITVPEVDTKFWFRFNFPDGPLDSPAIWIIPLENTVPIMTDQPDDMLFSDSDSMPLVMTLGAVGGDLKYLWFTTEPDGEPKMLESGFYGTRFGNTFSMWVENPNRVSSMYALIWNDQGTIGSRVVNLVDRTIDKVHFHNYPRIVRIREVDILEQDTRRGGKFDLFWVDCSWVTKGEILREVGGQWVTMDWTDRIESVLPRGQQHVWVASHEIRQISESYPSGRYKYRLWAGSEYKDSEPFMLENEMYDAEPLNAHPAAYPLAPGKPYTSGGGFSAHVYFSQWIKYSTVQIYAGPIGDRSHPVEFTHDAPQSVWAQTGRPDLELGEYETIFEWVSTGDEVYWLEARTFNDDLVRCILRYPGADAAYAPAPGGSNNLTIPYGAKVIPIANSSSLGDVSIWRFGQNDWNGLDIETPLTPSDLVRPFPDLTLWTTDGTAVDVFDLGLDQTAPPQILQMKQKAAVLPDGRVLSTAPVNGDVTSVDTYFHSGDGSWQYHDKYYLKVTEGFTVPAWATHMKTVYHMDELQSEAEYELVHIQPEFMENLSIARSTQDACLSEWMGSFLNMSGYPFIQHADLGWMVVLPYQDGLVFYAETAPGKWDWHWTNADLFPKIYNFETQGWLYHTINGYGWFWDYSKENWHRVSRN